MITDYADEIQKILVGNVWTVTLLVYGEYFTVDVSHRALTEKDKVNWSTYGEKLTRIQSLIAGWINSTNKLISVENLDLVTGLLTVNDQPFIVVRNGNTNEHIHRYLQEQANKGNS